MEKFTVYINNIPIVAYPWMEIRHILYKKEISFEDRDAVISGKKVIKDSSNNEVFLETKLKNGEKYIIEEANINSIKPKSLPSLKDIFNTINLTGDVSNANT